jgi:hypothetical protein
MSWGNWMVPELSVEQLLSLEKGVRALRNEGPANKEKVVDLAADLWRQHLLQQSIISKATRHITELEARLAVAECDVQRLSEAAPAGTAHR